MRKHKVRVRIIVVSIILLVFILLGILIVSKKIRLNSWFANSYDVQGIDVSHYQGEIDWQTIQKYSFDFVFIKATEGSKHVDENFRKNWEGASSTNMKVGVYHFFSFDSPAREQIKNFINTIGDLSGKLAPVIDIEYYGEKEKNPPDVEKVRAGLKDALSELENRYRIKPILYTTYKVYNRYIRGDFDEYPLWIRNVYYPPFDTKSKWTFWQFSDREVLDGYNGEEKYIDRNVFCGTREELDRFICS